MRNQHTRACEFAGRIADQGRPIDFQLGHAFLFPFAASTCHPHCRGSVLAAISTYDLGQACEELISRGVCGVGCCDFCLRGNILGSLCEPHRCRMRSPFGLHLPSNLPQKLGGSTTVIGCNRRRGLGRPWDGDDGLRGDPYRDDMGQLNQAKFSAQDGCLDVHGRTTKGRWQNSHGLKQSICKRPREHEMVLAYVPISIVCLMKMFGW
mmetsp:Transcript_112627/g.290912  ORF Transcript_112627/g.290912 Transcript_112627/m.290912 type:complete len:208 (-) Transcript_112627:154-777(-)